MARRKKLSLKLPKLKKLKLDLTKFKLDKLDLTSSRQGFAIVLLGIIVALILGGLAITYGLTAAWIYWVLGIGVLVGILNIFHKEGIVFLLLGLTLVFMFSLLAGSALFSAGLIALLNAIVYLLAPATIVVGLKVLYALASK